MIFFILIYFYYFIIIFNNLIVFIYPNKIKQTLNYFDLFRTNFKYFKYLHCLKLKYKIKKKNIKRKFFFILIYTYIKY